MLVTPYLFVMSGIIVLRAPSDIIGLHDKKYESCYLEIIEVDEPVCPKIYSYWNCFLYNSLWVLFYTIGLQYSNMFPNNMPLTYKYDKKGPFILTILICLTIVGSIGYVLYEFSQIVDDEDDDVKKYYSLVWSSVLSLVVIFTVLLI